MAKKHKSGVYCIYNTKNQRSYVGSSVNISSRLNRHKYDLIHNKHPNYYMQNDFNIHKFNSFAFFVLVFCEPEMRLIREQEWLNALFDNQQQCYNINPIAESPKGRKYTKEQHSRHLESQNHRKTTGTVIAPNGIEVVFTGMREFCRNNNLRFSSFCDMINGKLPSSEGWRLPKNRHFQTGQTLPKFFNVKLKDPQGNIHGPFHNLEKFCKIHKLRASSIRHLIAGRIKSSLGWTVC